jgi:hypothetical protein
MLECDGEEVVGSGGRLTCSEKLDPVEERIPNLENASSTMRIYRSQSGDGRGARGTGAGLVGGARRLRR